MTWIVLAGAFCAVALTAHLASTALAAHRCRRRPRLPAAAPNAPPVSVIRPLCGLENYLEATLRSSFHLDYPAYELLFCVARPDDPAIALVRRLMDEYPHMPARLLIGDGRIGANPKLNNMVKGWRATAHRHVLMADSNVLMPRDYLQRLFANLRPDTGLVCTPPAGCLPRNVWAELECAFLNSYQARWQYAADSVGLGFAQGKGMLWRWDDIERLGGLRSLAAEAAEDAAATKLVRASGKRVRLADIPAAMPLGRRRFSEVWQRQARWARLRRASFPQFFIFELLTGGILPLLAIACLAAALAWPILVSIFIFAAVWYGAEMLLSAAAGWPLSLRAPLLGLLRDLLLPALWISAFGNAFEWRGNAMQAAERASAS